MSLRALGREILASQPFSVLLGAELLGLSSGAAEIRVPIGPQLLQQRGSVHGGVIGYAADNSITFAGGSVLGPAVVTSEFKINYLQPARGDFPTARAAVIHHGRRQAVGRCDIFALEDGDEVLCASAQGAVAKLSRP